MSYGVPATPRDFDIVPDLHPENLTRLADLLRRWDAEPKHDPQWPESLTVEECARWTPDPPTPENLDHLMVTPHGLFDVVPTRAMPYDDLIRRALPVAFEKWTILIAHPADLIATMRMHKAKHQAREPRLTEVRERLERGEAITPVLPFGDR
jgi:hypothetical protein